MQGDLRELASGPGTDTRQWTSYGQVIASTGTQKSVRFTDDSGAPLAHGVLVDVKLEPSGIEVPCRVVSSCAGNGEGEWHPFVDGDEVLVAIPEGNERAGCVILGRLNNKHDVFPQKVAGMDATSNTFGFRRHVMPFVVEVGGGYSIRQVTTGSAVTIDQTGQVFVTEGGTGAQLVLTPDVVGLMLNGGTCGFQIDVVNGIVLMSANRASLTLDDAVGSKWQSKGVLSVSTCGNPGLNHVTTIEGVCQLLQAFCAQLAILMVEAASLTATPGGAAAPGFTAVAAQLAPGASIALLSEALLAAGSPTFSFAPLIGPIQTALLVPKVPLENAGVGSPGFWVD